MIKNILTLVFAMFVACVIPSSATAANSVEVVETDFQQITISYSNFVLRITGAEGEVLQIYNVAGIKVLNAKVESDDKRFEINLPKGCYIVKVGKCVRKISVK